jgi:hypothetical protein
MYEQGMSLPSSGNYDGLGLFHHLHKLTPPISSALLMGTSMTPNAQLIRLASTPSGNTVPHSVLLSKKRTSKLSAQTPALFPSCTTLPCCHIWIPRNDIEGHGLLPSALANTLN